MLIALGLAVAAQNVDQLVLDHFLDGGAGGLQILAGVKLGRIVGEELTDSAGHSQTQIGVDVDLTNSHGSGLAQLLLGHADGVGHVAAILIDHLHKVLRNGRRAMQNDGEAGQTLGDILQNVEAQGRGNQDAVLVESALLGSELIGTVAGTDGDGQRVTAGLGNELLDLLGTGVRRMLGRNANLVLDACQRTKLGLDGDAVVVSIFNDLAGNLDIFGKGLGGSVDHDGSKAAIDTALTSLKAVAVIQMKGDGQTGLDDGSLNQLHQVGVVGIGTSTLGNLQNHGSIDFHGGFGDALNDFHVVDVESADGITAIVSQKNASKRDNFSS